MLVCKYLKMCREKSKLSQSGISEALGLTTPQLVSNVERGLQKPPKDSLLTWVDLVGADLNQTIALYLYDELNNFCKVRYPRKANRKKIVSALHQIII